MSIEEVLEDVKRHLDYVEATKQMSIRDNQMKEMYFEIERLNNIIKEVREYIESELWNYFEERNVYLKVRNSFLEILDKGE